MKKNIIIFILLLCGLLCGGYFYVKNRRYELAISQQQIDAALAKRFPISKKYLLFLEITYSNPQVTLLEDSEQVAVGLDATLNIRIKNEHEELKGKCLLTSGVRYHSATQEFFLDDAEFKQLEISGVPTAYLDQVTKFASNAAREFVETQPIYKLKAKDAKTSAAKLLLKNLEVRDQAVHVTLGL